MGRGDRRGLAGAPARLMQGVWRVFATYVAAVAGIFAASGMAIVTLRSMFPDTPDQALLQSLPADRKSTRLNSSHLVISYAVFCLKKKKPLHRAGSQWMLSVRD